jgi:MFS transporter, Spinster family, sphingosine-1-phosphate transporter
MMAVIMETAIASDVGLASAPAQEKGAAVRWYVLVLLVLVTACSAIDRNLVPILTEPIKKEFLLSDSQLGLLTGGIYAISFSIIGLPVGFLIDRTHRVRLLSVLVAIWSLMTTLSGFAGSYLALVLARIGVGGAESGAPPTSMSILMDYFPIKQRGTALGWYYASAPIGLALGFAIGGMVAAHLDWRAAFFVVGAPGLVLALLLALTVREPVRGAFDTKANVPHFRPSLSSVLALLWERKALPCLILGGVMVIIAWSGLVAFLAPYLIRVQHLPIGDAGLVIAATLGTTGLIGMPLGGFIADRLARRSEVRALIFTAAILVLTAVAAAAAFYAPDLRTCIIFTGLFSALTSIFYGPMFRTYLNNSPAAARGVTGAFLIVAMNLVGYGVGPTLTGLLSDYLKTDGYPQPLQAALVIMAGFYVLGAAALVAASIALARSSHRA